LGNKLTRLLFAKEILDWFTMNSKMTVWMLKVVGEDAKTITGSLGNAIGGVGRLARFYVVDII
jgi:hypothetical protein